MKYFLICSLFCQTLMADEIKEVLIPFANLSPTKSTLEIAKYITGSRTTTLEDHLVESHNCPRWVVDHYRHSPNILVRIHRGYELQSAVARAGQKIKEYNESVEPKSNQLHISGLDKYYLEEQRYYNNQYKILRITIR